MNKTQSAPKPVASKMHGSHFPALPQQAYYEIETVTGQTLYSGPSQHVARLVAACMAPRTF